MPLLRGPLFGGEMPGVGGYLGDLPVLGVAVVVGVGALSCEWYVDLLGAVVGVGAVSSELYVDRTLLGMLCCCARWEPCCEDC